MSNVAPQNSLEKAIKDKKRLTAVQKSGLLESKIDQAFDRFTTMAQKLIGVSVSLISIVDEDRQFFVSSQGLAEPYASERETPLSHSFCQYVVAEKKPLIIDNSLRHDLLKDNKGISALNVIAYLGVPLFDPGGEAIGAICAIDSSPRHWKEEDIQTLSQLAEMTMSEIRLRRRELELLQFTEKLEEIVSERTLQVRRLAENLALAEQNERKRIAQELHDHQQQLLVAIKMQASIAKSCLSNEQPESAQSALSVIEEAVEEALVHTRTLTNELSPLLLHEQGLVEALHWLGERMKTLHGLNSKIEFRSPIPLHGYGVEFVYQAIRELLFNVVKHAETSEASVILFATEEQTVIEVSDKGRGFSPTVLAQGSGLGLSGLEERLMLINGSLHLASSKEGTAVTIKINHSPKR